MQSINKSSVVFLCRGSGCCPSVQKTDDGIEIKDDFGGTVRMTDEQFSILKEMKVEGESPKVTV